MPLGEAEKPSKTYYLQQKRGQERNAADKNKM